MVRCEQCKQEKNKEKYTDPFESALRSRDLIYIIRTYLFPQYTNCNVQSCDNTAEYTGWFERNS